jgi:NitT/TauT family transport system substrate-binding protein
MNPTSPLYIKPLSEEIRALGFSMIGASGKTENNTTHPPLGRSAFAAKANACARFPLNVMASRQCGGLLRAGQAANLPTPAAPQRAQAKEEMRMRVDRRDILALSAGGLFLLSASRAASAAELKTVRVGKAIISSFPFAGVELGVKQGIWKSVGLNAEISVFRGDGQLQQALAAGSVDFGFGSGPGMGYAAKGVPAHAVAVVANRPANMALVVAKASRITSIQGLKGKRIGVSTAGSLTDWLTRNIATSQKWKPSDIEIVPMGEMRTRLAAMRSGELAGAVTSVQEAYEIQDNGQGTVLTTFGELVPHFHTHVIFALDALIQKDPDLVRRFLKGWFTIAAFMRDHRAETVKATAATMHLSEKVLDETYDIETGMMSYDGQFDPQALNVIQHSLKDLQILDFQPEISKLYVGKFVPVKIN